MKTLLVDCNYFPVKVISWQKAITLLYQGKAQSLVDYSDLRIHSQTISLALPKILRLNGKHRLLFNIKFTRENVFYRDNYTCQYCGERLKENQLTFDHVIPASKGGPTTWQNVVTACKPCNFKKGPLLLEQTNLTLLKKPIIPKWSPELVIKLHDDDPHEWFEFLQITRAA